ncbi:MAG: hypothetical protein U0840_20250 [Gemmataceae bacterium]
MLVRLLVATMALVVPTSLAVAAAPPRVVNEVLLNTLVRQLDHDEFEVRQAADEALRQQEKAIVGYLREEMRRTKSVEVRWRLGRIVQALTMDERVEGLVQLLADRDASTRDRAVWSLRQAGPAVVPLLQRELRAELPIDQRKRLEKIIAELNPPGR